ncbi:MAG: two-component regulator propeller domain-containing protein [Nocardioidaceae bacterium]
MVRQVKKYYYHYNDSTSIAANEVYGICEDKSGRLWFAHYNAGLSCLDKKTGRFVRVQKTGIRNKTLSSDRIFGLYCDKDGFLWARSINGISKIDPKNFSVQNFDDPSFSEITNIITNTDLVEMQEYIWFSSKTAGVIKN